MVGKRGRLDKEVSKSTKSWRKKRKKAECAQQNVAFPIQGAHTSSSDQEALPGQAENPNSSSNSDIEEPNFNRQQGTFIFKLQFMHFE